MAKWISLLLVLTLSSPVLGEPFCATRAPLLKRLGETYHEVLVAQALTSDGNLLEVLAAPDGATWTLLLTGPDGVSCGLAAGAYWVPVDTKPEEAEG